MAQADSRGVRAALPWVCALCIVAPACAAWGADGPAPTPEEQVRFIQEARRVVGGYAGSLPDFLCTQTVKRYVIGLNNVQRPQDTLTIEVSFRNGSDHYELSQVNGQRADQELLSQGGMQSLGEFGSNLLIVFGSRGEFHFVKWTTLNKRPAVEYSYKIAPAESSYELRYWDSTHNKTLREVVGLRGEIVLERATHAVLRIQYIADAVPDSFPMRGSSTVEYDYTRLGDRVYLLPSTAVVRTTHDRIENRNNVEFHSYRKFSTESQLTFGEPPPRR